jgi:hypothetical protein
MPLAWCRDASGLLRFLGSLARVRGGLPVCHCCDHLCVDSLCVDRKYVIILPPPLKEGFQGMLPVLGDFPSPLFGSVSVAAERTCCCR